MNVKKQRIRNLTLLTGFAAVFSVVTLIAVKADRRNDEIAMHSVVEHEMVLTMASSVGESAKSGLLYSQNSFDGAGNSAQLKSMGSA